MEQSEEKTEAPANRWWFAPALAIFLLVLPALYVLSAGPYVYLTTRGVIDPRSAFGKIYWPLQWVQIQYPPFMGLMNRYGRMWRYQPPPPKTTPAASPSDVPRRGDIE